jgi:hypothetical protein
VVMNAHNADYQLCDNCGFMFVDNPTWLEEAYASPINLSDTGYVMRNIYLSKKTLVLFSVLFGTKKNYLDYAGGYGMLTRIMRDYGLNYFNDDVYTENLFAQGFEFEDQKITALTCFECFEHLPNPIEEIEKMLTISKNVFFSTRLLPAETPNDEWEYYGFDHGQHISFYSKKTLEFIAKKNNLFFYTNNDNLHMFTNKKINKLLFNIILLSTKLQIDIFFKKMLKSKTTQDSNYLKQLS